MLAPSLTVATAPRYPSAEGESHDADGVVALALVALVSVADAATRRDTHARMPAAPSPGADAYLGFADASHGDQLLVRAVLEEPENGAQLHDVETGACRAAGFANVTERARAVLRQK